jgi:hypothetical protein
MYQKILGVAFLLAFVLLLQPIKAANEEIGSQRLFEGILKESDNLSNQEIDDLSSQPTVGETDIAPIENGLDAIKDKVIKGKRLISQLDSASFFSLPLGISGGGDKGDDYAIIIDKATIYAEYAEFSAFMVLTNPMDGKKVRFRAEKIQFTFKGGLSGNIKLALLDTISTRIVNDVKLNWLPNSFVEWDCNGFKQIGLNGEIELNENTFVGVNPTTGASTGKVKTAFYSTFSDFNNFTLDISFTPFKIKGFDEAYFSFENVVLDFSDYSNSPNFKLPSGYPGGFTGEMAPLWRGLYIKRAQVFLSGKFKKKSGTVTSFFAENLIVDDYGFTGLCGVDNLLTLQEGQLGNWAMSINRLAVEFYTGSFKSLTLKGGTILPGSSTEMKYDAFFDVEGAFHLGIVPGSDITFNALAAKVVINKTSKIEVYVDQNKFVPTAILNGTISFGAGKDTTSTDKGFVNLPNLVFQGMRISAAPPVFDLTYLGFASDEGLSFNKFPITLTAFNYKKRGEKDAVFTFGIKINLVPAKDDALTAETVLALVTDISGSKWKFKGVELNKLAIHAEKPNAYKIDGEVMFANGDAIYGDGFRGQLKAVFANDIGVDALAIFGNTNGFRYFLVDALVSVNPGIACGPIILNGFGGGLYYKMRQNLPGESGGSDFGKGLSGLIYVPDNNKSIGIKAAIRGAIVKKELVDAKVSFEINFTPSGGIAQIAFAGEALILTPPKVVGADQMKELAQKAAKGQGLGTSQGELMRATMLMQLDFENKVYHNELELYVNIAGVLTGRGANNRAGWCVMHIEPGKWYFHMGTPTDPIGLKFVGLMEVGGYFMAGHDIPDAMKLPDNVLKILNMSPTEVSDERATGDISTGKGLAFGASFALNTGEKTFLIFYGQVEFGGGFDVLLLDYGKNASCKDRSGSVGINGWYAKGQAYAYLSAEIGISVKVFFKRRKFNILKLATAAALQLQGPNPVWIQGNVGGQYSVLGGMIKGRCNFEFEMGEKCIVEKSKDLSDIEIIASTAPSASSTDVDIFTLPQVVFNLPVGVAAKISEDPKSTQQFRVKLNEISIYQGTTLVPGAIEWDADRKTLAFTPNTIFSPNTKYKIVVKAGFEQSENGSSWEIFKGDDGSQYLETRETVFETGNLPDKIPTDYVTHTYPIHRMMNFYKSETSTAYVTFKADLLPFFQPQTGWSQSVKWSPVTGGNAIYSTLRYVQGTRSAETTIPTTLSNSTVYRMELVNIPQSDNNSVDRNVIQKASQQLTGEGENSASVTTREAVGVISEAEEKAFYSISFRCSKFNKFFDKVPATELPVRFLYNVSAGIDYPGATIFGTEMLDGYEIEGTSTFEALVNCQAVLESADWYQNNIYSLFYQNYPLHPTATVSRNTSLLGLPPVKPIAMWQLDFGYVMSDADLESGQMQSEATLTHFVNYLPGVWAKDYSEIRNQLANLVSNKTIATTPAINRILNTFPWPQVSAGNYPIRIEYRLPGRKTVTSSKIINIKNSINVTQVNLIPNE